MIEILDFDAELKRTTVEYLEFRAELLFLPINGDDVELKKVQFETRPRNWNGLLPSELKLHMSFKFIHIHSNFCQDRLQTGDSSSVLNLAPKTDEDENNVGRRDFSTI